LKIPRVAAACAVLIEATRAACLAPLVASPTGSLTQIAARAISAMNVLIVTRENGDESY